MGEIDVDNFMARVRDQGFNIEDQGWKYGVIRRFSISKGDKKNYVDIDKHLLSELTQDDLFKMANQFMCKVKEEEV
jgi:hypothetical protein